MNLKTSPQADSLRSGTHPESDEENGYSEEASIHENGDNPRKRQRRPMSVS